MRPQHLMMKACLARNRLASWMHSTARAGGATQNGFPAFIMAVATPSRLPRRRCPGVWLPRERPRPRARRYSVARCATAAYPVTLTATVSWSGGHTSYKFRCPMPMHNMTRPALPYEHGNGLRLDLTAARAP